MYFSWNDQWIVMDKIKVPNSIKLLGTFIFCPMNIFILLIKKHQSLAISSKDKPVAC